MKIYRDILISIALVSSLYGCDGLVNTTSILTPTALASLSPINTQANILQPIPTKIETMTSDQILPNYYRGIAPLLTEFTMLKEEQLQIVMSYIMMNPELNLDPKVNMNPSYYLSTRDTGTMSEIILKCNYEESCRVRASIIVRNLIDKQSDDIWMFIWEVGDSNGEHQYIMTYIGGIWAGETKNYAELTLNQISRIEQGQPINIAIITSIYGEAIEKIDTNALRLINGPDSHQSILWELEQGNKKLPKRIFKMIFLCLFDFDGNQ